MLKLTIASSLDSVCEFIDNRLILQMSEKDLRQIALTGLSFIMIKEKFRLKNIDNTVLYTERDQNRASMVIATTHKNKGKGVSEFFGMTLRAKSDKEVDVYVDVLAAAFSKGILSSEMAMNSTIAKVAAIVLVLFVLIGAMVATGGLIFLLAVVTTVFGFPFILWKVKSNFAAGQKKMRLLLSLFEAEFPVSNKMDTKDSLTFFLKVKSETADISVK